MRKILVCLSAGTLALLFGAAPDVFAQGLARTDPHYRELFELSESIGWYRVPVTNAWAVGTAAVRPESGAVCRQTLDKLRGDGVPDARTIKTSWDSPEFPAGVHTLAEIRKSCEHVDRVGKIAEFEKAALLAMDSRLDARYDTPYFKLCQQAYDKLISAGFSPAEQVPERKVRGVLWSGSIGELKKKYCDGGGMGRGRE